MEEKIERSASLIIKKLMDDICYERCGNKNILRLKKKFGKSAS